MTHSYTTSGDLTKAGFKNVRFYDSLVGQKDESQPDLLAITARKLP